MKKLLTFALIGLSGCATLTASGDQDINVSTSPAGAACILGNSQQTVTLDSTPGVANVSRMFEPLTVTCTLAGYQPGSTVIEAKTRGRAYGNILLLGVPALVDASNGHGYEYSPDTVDITLTPAQ